MAEEVTVNDVAPLLSSLLRTQVQREITKAGKEPHGSARRRQLVRALRSDDESKMIYALRPQMLSDAIIKPAMLQAFEARGHRVRREDCSTHDTVECGFRTEYKAARLHAQGNKLGIWVSNSGSASNVKIELMVADSLSTRIADASFYRLNLTAVRRFGHALNKGTGWQFKQTESGLTNPNGFGQYRHSLVSYLENRQATCKCR